MMDSFSTAVRQSLEVTARAEIGLGCQILLSVLLSKLIRY